MTRLGLAVGELPIAYFKALSAMVLAGVGGLKPSVRQVLLGVLTGCRGGCAINLIGVSAKSDRV